MTIRDALYQRAVNAKADLKAVFILTLVGSVAAFFFVLLVVIAIAVVDPSYFGGATL